MTTPTQFFGWVQKHARANGLKVKRHFAYHHADGLLLELLTVFEGSPRRCVWDADVLYAPDLEKLIERDIRRIVR